MLEPGDSIDLHIAIVGEIPHAESTAELFNHGSFSEGQARSAYLTVVTRLAEHAQQIEETIGLPPLTPPIQTRVREAAPRTP